jgi:hypothetical protein
MDVLQPIAYAHSKQRLPKDRRHALEDHLQGTAKRASDFAGKFESATWGWYAGLWHDLGKFAPDWQSFLIEAGEDASSLGEETPVAALPLRRRGPDHSTAGALHAREVIKNPIVLTFSVRCSCPFSSSAGSDSSQPPHFNCRLSGSVLAPDRREVQVNATLHSRRVCWTERPFSRNPWRSDGKSCFHRAEQRLHHFT